MGPVPIHMHHRTDSHISPSSECLKTTESDNCCASFVYGALYKTLYCAVHIVQHCIVQLILGLTKPLVQHHTLASARVDQI